MNTKPKKLSVSVIVPVYNEEKTVVSVLTKVVKALNNRVYEIIVIDDGSYDRTHFLVNQFITNEHSTRVHYIRNKHHGKGYAVRNGIEVSKNDLILIQDADDEYDPDNYENLLQPLDVGGKVVYGSRSLKNGNHQRYFLDDFFTKTMTSFTNFLFKSKLTDQTTGCKLFHRSVFTTIHSNKNDATWETDITAKILKANIPIIEVPIDYHQRTFQEGKRLYWWSGVKSFFVLIYCYLFHRN